MSAIASPLELQAPVNMFSIAAREDPAGRVIVMGKASRKWAKTFLNIPLGQATKERLEARLVGSLAMGTSALIEWALDELTRQGVTLAPSLEPEAPVNMFSITTREDPAGRILVMGKASRKRAKTFLNIPLGQATKERLEARLVGSLAMGTSALIEWALDELTRQGVTLEARVQS
jgi:hypothetical protein